MKNQPFNDYTQRYLTLLAAVNHLAAHRSRKITIQEGSSKLPLHEFLIDHIMGMFRQGVNSRAFGLLSRLMGLSQFPMYKTSNATA
jgi:hypothetical protein